MYGACPVITDRELLVKGLTKWLKASNQVNNAIKILDDMLRCQEKYKVNLVFVYGIFKQEQQMGTVPYPPSCIPISFNNWGSVKARYDLDKWDTRTWRQFSSTTAMVDYEMYLFVKDISGDGTQ